MALQSILQDFEVRQGLIILGTATVTSSTGMTATLQAYGGAAIAKNLIVGTSADIKGDGFVRSNFTVEGASYLAGVTATNTLLVNTTTLANINGAGALQVTGGGYFGGNLVVNSIASSTATTTSNALYVAGGVGIGGGLYVTGKSIFQNDVIFQGDTTYVYTTNTIYTDNILELHYHEDTSGFTVNDGMDIGLRFHFYDTENTNGFLGRDNATGYLEWLGRGVTEESTGTIEVGEYGTFRTGAIKLVGGEANSGNTTTGDLQVLGGVGIAGSAYLSGNVNAGSANVRDLTTNRVVFVGANGKLVDDADLSFNTSTKVLNALVSNATTATNIAGGASGSLVYQTANGQTGFIPIGAGGLLLLSNGSEPVWATTSSVVAGAAFTASNLLFGEQYQIPYQTGPGLTAFEHNFRYNYDTDTLLTVNAQFTGTTNASSTITGALVVSGGVGIGGNLYVGGNLFANVSGSSSSSTNVATVATNLNAAHYLTFVDSNNAATAFELLYTTSSVSFNPNNGNLTVGGSIYGGATLFITGVVATSSVSAGSLISTGTLQVTGLSTLGETTATTTRVQTLTSYGDVDIQSATLSSSTTTGALKVAGGVGIGEDLFVGQKITGLLPNGELLSLGNTSDGTDKYISIKSLYGSMEIGRNGNTNAYINTNMAVGTFDISHNATKIQINASNEVVIPQTTVASSTNSGALKVAGGVGIGGNLYAGGDLYVGGNEVLTGDLAVNGGDITTTETTASIFNSNATTVNFVGAGTAITIGATTGYTAIRNLTTITDTTNATSHLTGALQVRGGVGISGALWVNQTLRVVSNSTLGNVSAAVTTATQLQVNGTANITGVLSVTETQDSNATTNGALRVSGGVGIAKNITAGGAITVGVTAAATTGTVVPALYSNNLLLSTYTSPVLTNNDQTNLDSFSGAVYRSARYFCQIKDGSNVHISEISLFHDDVEAYINEYGIATNNGQLGTFDAEYSLGTVTVKFTPFNATAMTIKMVRIGVTS